MIEVTRNKAVTVAEKLDVERSESTVRTSSGTGIPESTLIAMRVQAGKIKESCKVQRGDGC